MQKLLIANRTAGYTRYPSVDGLEASLQDAAEKLEFTLEQANASTIRSVYNIAHATAPEFVVPNVGMFGIMGGAESLTPRTVLRDIDSTGVDRDEIAACVKCVLAVVHAWQECGHETSAFATLLWHFIVLPFLPRKPVLAGCAGNAVEVSSICDVIRTVVCKVAPSFDGVDWKVSTDVSNVIACGRSSTLFK